VDPLHVTAAIAAISLFCRYNLNVWDVGGQKTIRSYWRNYFESTDGVVWVVDSADKKRLLDCKEELFSLLKQEKLAGASLLVLELGTHEAYEGRHWSIEGCSAYTGEGLVEGVDWIVGDIASRIFMGD